MGAYLGGVLCILIGAVLAANIRPVEASALLGQRTATPKSSGTDKAVIPTLKCALHNPDGTFTALFGYDNRNDERVTIPIGEKNQFQPSPKDRGQTTHFETGAEQVAFRVVYHEDDKLTWSLTGPDGKTHSVTASDGTPRCDQPEEKTATPRPTHTPTKGVEPTRKPTDKPEATRTPTEVSSPPEATATPRNTDVPPTHTATPTWTSVPPVASATPQNTSIPPVKTSTPTAIPVVRIVPTSTPTVTSIPTLAPPTPAASITPALIPVTGADRSGANPVGLPAAKGLVDLGVLLIGLGVVLHGIRLKLVGRG
jgi:hypothetical protein